ncbi:MAG: glycine oxidase ThiO [Alicyclobacillaceae bacterium]|nr:glycine oxidase ThiO [Alicyclobacillaceae bacterium]
MKEQHADVAVVGSGLIGCSIAWHLARKGVRTLVLEANSVGSGASFAGAGMLGAQVEMHEPGPLFELGLSSRAMFRNFCEELREQTGIDPEYVPEGIVRLASSPEEAEELQNRGKWQRERGLQAEWWTPEDVQALLGIQAESCTGALYLPDDHRVEAPRLARALARGALLQGARIREGEPVLDIAEEGDGVTVTGVRDVYRADRVVVAAGAWSSLLLRRFSWSGRVFPVKGEGVVLQATLLPLRRTAFARDVYLVPKNDGRLYLGATEQPGDWSSEPSLEAVSGLMDRARRRIPDLGPYPIAEIRVGLRPVTPDGFPYLGPLPGHPRIWIAAGHARNGILMAPATGRLIAEWMTGGTPSPLLEAFTPARSAPAKREPA